MIYCLSFYLRKYFSLFNVLHYISFRMIASFLTALILSFIFGSWFVSQSQLFRCSIRQYTPENHKAKNNTPTMGGIFILITTILTVLMWCDLTKSYVWIFLMCICGFGLIGLWDDWEKINTKKGIKESTKFKAQLFISLLVAFLWFLTNSTTILCVPFFKNFYLNFGVFIIPWIALVLVASSNAVNITDGLDGLAIGSLLSNFATFSIISYLASNLHIANYLNIPFTSVSEITVIGCILCGASLGFLWYNTHPAQIFMGDVGSLSLGSALAFMAIMARQELLLILSGGLFVVETLSVIIQVLSSRFFKKRIFKMAPIHHHFELLGWPETKITLRFCIISFILCLLTLITLKIR